MMDVEILLHSWKNLRLDSHLCSNACCVDWSYISKSYFFHCKLQNVYPSAYEYFIHQAHRPVASKKQQMRGGLKVPWELRSTIENILFSIQY